MSEFATMSSALNSQRWPVRNASGEEIPPFACMKIVGTREFSSGEIGFYVQKPDAFGAQYGHIFNGPRSISASGNSTQINGEGTIGFAVAALYDSADGTPAFGESWGPRSGTWKLKKNTGGFRVLDGYVTGRVDTTNSVVLVQSVPMLSMIGKTDSLIYSGTSGTVSIYWSSSGSGGLADTTVNVIAYNRFADVATGKWVSMTWYPWGDTTAVWEMHPVEAKTATIFTA